MSLLLLGVLATAAAIAPRVRAVWRGNQAQSAAGATERSTATSTASASAIRRADRVDQAAADVSSAAAGQWSTATPSRSILKAGSPIANPPLPASAARWVVSVRGNPTVRLPRTAPDQPTAPVAAALAAAHGAPPRYDAPAIQSAHPRMLLDADTLTRLRGFAAANTPEWQQLKATCDEYIGGTVNYPTQDQYPDPPDLGSGYEGEVYMPVLLAEAMCYQVLKTGNPSAAAPYGAKAVDILMKMSTPYSTASGNQGWDPCYDDGYGMRNYGVGFGLGYDWVYELLTPAQRQQVYTTANAWITAWEAPNGCADFVYSHPLSNYYAGYFHAKAVIAIGTYGDNPSAPAEWNDWYTNQYAQRVQPYFVKNLAGGGWLEGYANYGPSAIRNMNLPMREVETATGVDLVHAATPFAYPQDSALYAMHFTWPSRAYFDDRDTNHANGNPTPPVGTTQFGMFQQMLGALAYWGSPWMRIFHQYLDDVGTVTGDYNPEADWLAFLDSSSSLPTAPVDSLPQSYLASGIGAVAARSDWSTNASWMSFRAAPYIENPNQGEEGFDQGSLALVRGNTPLLVNATGWLVHEPNGSSDENLVYNDLYADFDGTQYNGNRELYNVFYVRHMSGSTVAERFGQAAYTAADNGATTKVAAFEDGGDYVFVQATGLADMYRPFSSGPAVASWTRQIVFLRPNRFIVFDRTTAGNAAWDQYMAWHFPANPVAGSAPTGENRIDITYQGQYAGAMTTVLPSNAGLTTVPLYPTSNPTKVWQVQERPSGTATANQLWLTVFDLSPSASAVATASAVNVTQGNMVGVLLAAPDGNSVVLQNAAAADTPVTGTISYGVPAGAAHHLILELAPNAGYSVSVTSSGGTRTISVTPGGAFISSPKGVLDFNVSAGGAATPRIAPPPREAPPPPAYRVGG